VSLEGIDPAMGRTPKTIMLGVLAAALAVAGPAYSACKLSKIAELPVTMAGSTPLVSARINGTDAILMSDSGAFFSMLTPTSLQKFKLKAGPAPFNLRVTGSTGEADVKLTTAKDFDVLGITLHDVDFLVGG
jgi:hypothetical protein